MGNLELQGIPQSFCASLKRSQDLMTTSLNVLAKTENHILHFQNSLCSVVCKRLCLSIRGTLLSVPSLAEHVQLKVDKVRTPNLEVWWTQAIQVMLCKRTGGPVKQCPFFSEQYMFTYTPQNILRRWIEEKCYWFWGSQMLQQKELSRRWVVEMRIRRENKMWRTISSRNSQK